MYAVACADPRVSLALDDAMRRFAVPGATALPARGPSPSADEAQPDDRSLDEDTRTLQLTVYLADLEPWREQAAERRTSPTKPPRRPSAVHFDSEGLWSVKVDDQGHEFVFSSPAYGPVPYRVARINQDFSAGEIHLHEPYWRDRAAINPLEYPLDELLLVHLLARHALGAELHGCGIVAAPRLGAGLGHSATKGHPQRLPPPAPAMTAGAQLFLGQSGAGKTTLARLWARQQGAGCILSDDRLVVRRAGDRCVVYGTPWHGDGGFSRPGPATPLRRIFFLKQASANAARALSRAEATARLFSCSFVPNYLRSDVERGIETLATIASAVPCYELSFSADPSVLAFLSELP